MLDTSSRFSAGPIALLDLAQHIGLRTLDDAARAFDLNARLARAWVTTTTDRLSAALPHPPAAGTAQVAASGEAAAAPLAPTMQGVAPNQPLQADGPAPASEPALAAQVDGLDADRPSHPQGVHLPVSLATQPPIVQAVHDAVMQEAAQPAESAAVAPAAVAAAPAATVTAPVVAAKPATAGMSAVAAKPAAAAKPTRSAKTAHGAEPASTRGRGVRSVVRGPSGKA